MARVRRVASVRGLHAEGGRHGQGAHGIAVKELRLLGRGLFVLDPDDRITHAEYVSELTNHPDYDAAIAAAKEAAMS